jgi:drug/metabolite transporter (DMT)-like permease
VNIPFYPALILLAALWGGSFLFLRIAAPVLGPVWLIALRVLIAGLVLLPLVARRGQLAELLRHWRPLLLVGCLNAAAPFTLLAYSALELTAGMTSILNATVPIFAALVGFLLYSDPLDARRGSGILLGFLGVLVLVGMPQGGTALPLLPVIAGLVAALSYVFAANLAKRRLVHIPGLVFVTGSQLGAAALMLPLLPWFVPQVMPGPGVVASVLALAVVCTSLAFLIYFRLLREVGPVRTLTVTYLIPVFAVAWGALLLDESLTLSMLFGGVLVLLGVALANRRPTGSLDVLPTRRR